MQITESSPEKYPQKWQFGDVVFIQGLDEFYLIAETNDNRFKLVSLVHGRIFEPSYYSIDEMQKDWGDIELVYSAELVVEV